MRATEVTCAAIVAVYCFLRLRAPGADRSAIAVRLLSLACAAWAGEDSVIRAYGFYAYAPGWSLFLDRVPLLIVAIWPVVIDSAHMLARRLASGAWRVGLLGGLIVLADAALIEPIAVHAHLWTWSASYPRALFDVPLVGVVGWAYFAAAAVVALERLERRHAGAWQDAVVIAVAPLATHAALVASWWGAFRWIGGDGIPWAPAMVAWCVLAAVTVGAWRRGGDVPLRTVMARAPGAAFFFALLGATSTDRADLVAYALAFAPPYVALIARRVSLEREAPAKTAAS